MSSRPPVLAARKPYNTLDAWTISDHARPGWLKEVGVDEQGAVIGLRAPEFSLFCTTGQEAERRRVSLADYQGRWLMLLFYPRDFSLV
jgi:hypothetical protein